MAKKSTQRLAAARRHAKTTLFEVDDGRKYVIESSANLRSCQSVEQFMIAQDAELYDFHEAWINDLMEKA